MGAGLRGVVVAWRIEDRGRGGEVPRLMCDVPMREMRDMRLRVSGAVSQHDKMFICLVRSRNA